jgi:hypothetical protein
VRAQKARATNARKAMLMEAAVESVNTFTTARLMRFVIGTAADSAEISKYATNCKKSNEKIEAKLLFNFFLAIHLE